MGNTCFMNSILQVNRNILSCDVLLHVIYALWQALATFPLYKQAIQLRLKTLDSLGLTAEAPITYALLQTLQRKNYVVYMPSINSVVQNLSHLKGLELIQ